MPVEVITLATLWNRERLDRIDMLKLDIEGAEYELIEASPTEILRKINVIALEYHPNGSKSDLFRRLDEAGFWLEQDEPSTDGYGLATFRLERSKSNLG